MSSRREYEFTGSWYNKKTSTFEKVLMVMVGVLLIPWLNLGLDLNLFKQKQKPTPRRTSYENRYLLTSQTLWRNSLVRIVRVKVPAQVLGYRRILASDEGLAFRPTAQTVSMLAVSRNAQPILEGNYISYIEPAKLPAQLVLTLELPFHTEALGNYLLVPEVASSRP